MGGGQIKSPTPSGGEALSGSSSPAGAPRNNDALPLRFLRLHLLDGRLGNAGEIVRQEIARARPHPGVKVDLLELAVVPGLDDFQVLIADVADRVAESHRDIGDVAGL